MPRESKSYQAVIYADHLQELLLLDSFSNETYQSLCEYKNYIWTEPSLIWISFL